MLAPAQPVGLRAPGPALGVPAGSLLLRSDVRPGALGGQAAARPGALRAICCGSLAAAATSSRKARRLRPRVAARAAEAAAATTRTRPALADDFRCLLLDCDGVLWRGSEVIPGSREAVQSLQARGVRLAFVTNASAKSRASVAERISATLGTPISPDDVVTSGSVAAQEALAVGAKTAFVIGAMGLREEMELAGVKVWQPSLPEPFDEAAFRELAAELPEVGAVVVGHDEAFSYAKLAMASLLLQRGGEACALIGTNPDVGNRDVAGYLVPEAGSLIAAVEAASGRRAAVVGKPSPEVIQQLLRQLDLQPQEVLVVGDRLDTDIKLGASAGVPTCLVLTGVSTQAEAEAAPASERPTHVRASLQDVVLGE